jgi:hypothetical protein
MTERKNLGQHCTHAAPLRGLPSGTCRLVALVTARVEHSIRAFHSFAALAIGGMS